MKHQTIFIAVCICMTLGMYAVENFGLLEEKAEICHGIQEVWEQPIPASPCVHGEDLFYNPEILQ